MVNYKIKEYWESSVYLNGLKYMLGTMGQFISFTTTSSPRYILHLSFVNFSSPLSVNDIGSIYLRRKD